MIRVVVDAVRPDDGQIARVAEMLRAGGLAAMPTDTLYGLAVDPFDASAVTRIFDVKGRAAEQALPLVAADVAQVERWLGVLPPQARRLAERFWPGPLTLLLPAAAALAPQVSGNTGRVGVRVPAHAVTVALCRSCDRPLTATSANISGTPPTADPEAVITALGGLIDVLVDAGQTPGGPPSTVVDVGGTEPRLLRAGAVSWEQVRACLELV